MGVKYPKSTVLSRPVESIFYDGGTCVTPPPTIRDIETATFRRGHYERESRPKPSFLVASPTARSYITATMSKIGDPVHRVSRRIPCGANPNDWQYEHSVVFAGYPDLDAVPPHVDINYYLRLKMLELKVNLSQDVPEFKQTVGMFIGAANTVVKAKKKAYWLAKRKLLDPAKLYLASTYGLEPTVGSMVSSLQALQAPNNDANAVRRVYVKKESKAHAEYIDPYRKIMAERTDTIKGTMYVTINKPNSNFYYGNPAIWAWELIPLSFVFDWFIDVGGQLQAMSAMTGFTVSLPPVISTRTKSETTGDFTVKGNGQAWSNDVTSSGSLRKLEAYSRTVGSKSLPISLLPQVGSGVHDRRIANAIALLISHR